MAGALARLRLAPSSASIPINPRLHPPPGHFSPGLIQSRKTGRLYFPSRDELLNTLNAVSSRQLIRCTGATLILLRIVSLLAGFQFLLCAGADAAVHAMARPKLAQPRGKSPTVRRDFACGSYTRLSAYEISYFLLYNQSVLPDIIF